MCLVCLLYLQDQLHPPDGSFPDAHADKGPDRGVYQGLPQHHQPGVAAHVLHAGGAEAHFWGQRRDRPGRPQVWLEFSEIICELQTALWPAVIRYD